MSFTTMFDELPAKYDAELLRSDDVIGAATDTSAVGLSAEGFVELSIESELRLSKKPISPSAIHIEFRALLSRSSSSVTVFSTALQEDR